MSNYNRSQLAGKTVRELKKIYREKHPGQKARVIDFATKDQLIRWILEEGAPGHDGGDSGDSGDSGDNPEQGSGESPQNEPESDGSSGGGEGEGESEGEGSGESESQGESESDGGQGSQGGESGGESDGDSGDGEGDSESDSEAPPPSLGVQDEAARAVLSQALPGLSAVLSEAVSGAVGSVLAEPPLSPEWRVVPNEYREPGDGDEPGQGRGAKHHKRFPECMVALRATAKGNDSGVGRILLEGPAASGKTTLAFQLAEALGVELVAVSMTNGTSEAELLGFQTISGDFVASPILRAWERGKCLILLDEAHNPDPSMLMAFNMALEQGVLSVPLRADRPMARPGNDVYVVIAGNDFSGNSPTYTSGQRQDGAMTDRFAGAWFHIDTDPAIVRRMGRPWIRNLVRDVRRAIERDDLGVTVTARAVKALEGIVVESEAAGMEFGPTEALARIVEPMEPQVRESIRDRIDVSKYAPKA